MATLLLFLLFYSIRYCKDVTTLIYCFSGEILQQNSCSNWTLQIGFPMHSIADNRCNMCMQAYAMCYKIQILIEFVHKLHILGFVLGFANRFTLCPGGGGTLLLADHVIRITRLTTFHSFSPSTTRTYSSTFHFNQSFNRNIVTMSKKQIKQVAPAQIIMVVQVTVPDLNNISSDGTYIYAIKNVLFTTEIITHNYK